MIKALHYFIRRKTMMKKLAKLTTLLAAAALLFGAVGCSDDDDDDIAVTGVTLDQKTASIKVGENVTLTATVAPADATNKTVTWSSSDESKATVKDGVVTGTAMITVTTEDGSRTAACEVTVTTGTVSGDPVAVMGVTLDQETASIKVGGTVTLMATVVPANATNKTVTWSSDNEGIATVNDSVVTGMAAGTATITVKTVDGGKIATCAVEVKEPDADTPPSETTSFTADFGGLEASVFGLSSLTASNTTNLDAGETEVEFNSVTVTLKASTSGPLRVRADENGKSVSINYNGSSFSNNTTTIENNVEIDNLRTYIAVSVTAAGTVTVTYSGNGSGNGKDGAKIALLGGDGVVLKTADVNTTQTNTTPAGTTISTPVTATTQMLYVMFSRENSTGGGIDVTKIEFTAAN